MNESISQRADGSKFLTIFVEIAQHSDVWQAHNSDALNQINSGASRSNASHNCFSATPIYSHKLCKNKSEPRFRSGPADDEIDKRVTEMAWILFIDESGHDRKLAPYEVLAGMAVQDHHVWELIKELHAAELRRFGRRYSAGTDELKGRKILKAKVFHHFALNTPISTEEMPVLARKCLDDGANASVREWKALAMAKLAYVSDVFLLCARFRCKVFGSVVELDAPGTRGGGLRKDYGYLFERFFYFLEDNRPREHGIIVFDELEKSQSHILIDQCHRYFKDTAIGRHRASLIVPEPFFVHSDLTTGTLGDWITFRLAPADKGCGLLPKRLWLY